MVKICVTGDRVASLREAALRMAPELEVLTLGRAFRAGMDESLREDFNTSRALGLAFELARAVNRLSNHPKSKKLGGPVVAPALEALDRAEQVGQSLAVHQAQLDPPGLDKHHAIGEFAPMQQHHSRLGRRPLGREIKQLVWQHGAQCAA